MDPAFRIHRRASVAACFSGLTPGEIAFLRELSPPSSPTEFPAFEFAGPDTCSVYGSVQQIKTGLRRITEHPRVPDRLRVDFTTHLDNYLRSDYKIECRGAVLDLESRTHVMGILNVTPDSFSDGGQFADRDRAVERARQMAAQGADIIDVGGESTRPGADALPEEEELRRIIPVIERLAAEIPAPISVDTYKSSVARKALAAGASIVNDISGLRFSPDMASVVADHGAALVLMHIKGTPRNMQQNPVYADIIGEIREYLAGGIEIALKAGVDRERILIDPGIGFGKTLEHNLCILDRLDEFRSLGRPIMVGTSRKRFIGTVLGIEAPDRRVLGTAATAALAIERGARVVRVHDVAQMVDVVRMTDAIIIASTRH